MKGELLKMFRLLLLRVVFSRHRACEGDNSNWRETSWIKRQTRLHLGILHSYQMSRTLSLPPFCSSKLTMDNFSVYCIYAKFILSCPSVHTINMIITEPFFGVENFVGKVSPLNRSELTHTKLFYFKFYNNLTNHHFPHGPMVREYNSCPSYAL